MKFHLNEIFNDKIKSIEKILSLSIFIKHVLKGIILKNFFYVDN